MATPQAGYPGSVSVANDSSGSPGTYSPVGGASKGSITPKVAGLDVTSFQTAGYKQSIPGLIDADIAVEFYYIPSDAGQQLLLTALTNRTRVWVKVMRDATHFSVAAAYVTEFPNDVEPGSAEKVQVKFVFDGTPTSPLTLA